MKPFVEVDQDSMLAAMLSGVEAILPYMIDRKWSVLHTNSGGIVCSDHPMTCSFVKPVPAMWTPAPSLPHTEINCPLSRHVFLIGSLDSPTLNLELTPKEVAFYNTRTLRGADRFVYSAERDFAWLRQRNPGARS
jgi:hypothetical protein